MKPWYSINNSAGGAAAELEIFDEIGPWGVTAKAFSRDLKAVTSDEINLSINTIGGDVFAGLGIFNLLKASGKKVHVKIGGLAASIGSIIAMAGDTITMPSNTFMMVHNPWTYAMGNSDELRETADVLDKIGASLTAIYVKRTGKTEDEIKALLQKDTYLSAQECIDLGFADALTDEVQVSAKFDVSDLPANVKAVFASASKPKNTPAKPAPKAKAGGDDPDDPDDELSNVEQLQAIADKAGVGEFVAILALDESVIGNPSRFQSAVAEAREIKQVCALLKMDDKAEGLVKARKTPAEARAALLAMKAEADKATHTSSQRKQTDDRAMAGAKLSINDIYSKRQVAKKGA